jgi:hypothetical protein
MNTGISDRNQLIARPNHDGVVDFHTKVTHCTFEFRVIERMLHSSKICSSPISDAFVRRSITAARSLMDP